MNILSGYNFNILVKIKFNKCKLHICLEHVYIVNGKVTTN